MGKCSSTHSSSHNHQPHTQQVKTDTTKPQTQEISPQTLSPQQTEGQIKNRWSEETKYDDVRKYYNITESFLGRGWTGIVFRANKISTNETFAIKTVWKSDVEQNNCFKNEIEITMCLNNEFVIHCEDVFEDVSSVHFIWECIHGGDLFDHILHSPGRKLPEAEAMDLLEQIWIALHYLHEGWNVVHRDVKPENFWMYNERGRNKLKLIDFGFAAFAKPDEYMTEQYGTPQYSAPEIFENEPYTSKVDLWAAGITWYNMITGMNPFSSNMETLKEQICNRQINYTEFKNEKLKELCMGLLDRDPKQRYSAFQALSALRLIKGEDSTKSTVPSDFKPDMKEIIYILNTDRKLGDDLRTIFIKYFSLEQLVSMEKHIKNVKTEDIHDDILSGKFYWIAEAWINFSLAQSNVSEEFKKEIKDFIEAKGIEKIKKQMINVTRFFYTAIECRKFIHKERVWHVYKKYDTNHRGFLTKNQWEEIFSDKTKRKNIGGEFAKPVSFEDFYIWWNKYENIKIDYSYKVTNSQIKFVSLRGFQHN